MAKVREPIETRLTPMTQCFASSPQTRNCSRSSPTKSGRRTVAAVTEVVNIVSIGSLTLAIVHPREVFKPLILMNAGAWICAHNHPSGDTAPSPEDRVLTSRLRQSADLLGISLLDHLILTDEGCYSFADQGWPGA